MSNINVREKVEWCNYYWDNADDASLPRVLLVGDSIALSYRPVVAELLKGKCNVDLMATSKGISDSSFKKELSYVLSEYEYGLIHFNNGLHAFHTGYDEYGQSLKDVFKSLNQKCPDTKLIWASSTPVTKVNCSELLDNAINDIVISRNRIAEDFMKINKTTVNDLYSLLLGNTDIRLPDAFHYNDEGCKLMGTAVAKAIHEELNR